MKKLAKLLAFLSLVCVYGLALNHDHHEAEHHEYIPSHGPHATKGKVRQVSEDCHYVDHDGHRTNLSATLSV